MQRNPPSMNNQDLFNYLEIQRIQSEIDKNKAEAEYFYSQQRPGSLKQKISAYGVIKATIAGVVASGLIAVWAITYFQPVLEHRQTLNGLKHEIAAANNAKNALVMEEQQAVNLEIARNLEAQRAIMEELKRTNEDQKAENEDLDRRYAALNQRNSELMASLSSKTPQSTRTADQPLTAQSNEDKSTQESEHVIPKKEFASNKVKKEDRAPTYSGNKIPMGMDMDEYMSWLTGEEGVW